MADNEDHSEAAGAAIDLRTVTPELPLKVLSKLSAFIEVKRNENPETLASSLRRLQELWQGENWSLELRAVALVLADLSDQGWEISADDRAIRLQPPGLRLVGESREKAKERLRSALQTGRNRQLADSGVQRFVQRMQRVVPRNGSRSSIADVIESGAELAGLLSSLAKVPISEAGARLRSVIDPVIELCDEDAKCAETGIRLLDIWRYFRHTWSLEYRSIPGRQICFLIRNAARPKKPVIGIAMLASPVLRMRVRDDWIGWNGEPFLAKLKNGDWNCEEALRALVSRLETNLAEIRWDDLISPDEFAFPTERTVLRLEQRCVGAAFARQRELETLYSEAEDSNEAVRSQRTDLGHESSAEDWKHASEDILFVRKRAETLARLLEAKRTFQTVDWEQPGPKLLTALLNHANGQRALNIALTEVRKAGLSSQVADVSVCGAVAPYNAILGGKLVALLMASREVASAYHDRYSNQVSIISSQMAGRPVYRPAELKILTTTSLYGNGSSQYNRLRFRAADYPELECDLEWQALARTAGYGSVHLSSTTIKVLREVSERTYRARRINHRFGEGSSPRLRQSREALEALGIDSGSVLHHATPRVFYALELMPNAREQLLGMGTKGNASPHPAALIAALWRERWLAKRIQSAEVLERVSHTSPQEFVTFFEQSKEAGSLVSEAS